MLSIKNFFKKLPNKVKCLLLIKTEIFKLSFYSVRIKDLNSPYIFLGSTLRFFDTCISSPEKMKKYKL